MKIYIKYVLLWISLCSVMPLAISDTCPPLSPDVPSGWTALGQYNPKFSFVEAVPYVFGDRKMDCEYAADADHYFWLSSDSQVQSLLGKSYWEKIGSYTVCHESREACRFTVVGPE